MNKYWVKGYSGRITIADATRMRTVVVRVFGRDLLR